jgi:hypothetical protein
MDTGLRCPAFGVFDGFQQAAFNAVECSAHDGFLLQILTSMLTKPAKSLRPARFGVQI